MPASSQYVAFSKDFTTKYGRPAWIRVTQLPTVLLDQAHRFNALKFARAHKQSPGDIVMTVQEAEALIDSWESGGRSLQGYSHGSINSKDLQGR